MSGRDSVVADRTQQLFGVALDDARSAGSLHARLARGTFWALAGMAAAQGIGLLVSVVTARFLGEAGFGELGILIGTLTVAGNLAGLGSAVGATKRVAEARATNPARVSDAVGAALSLASLAGLIAATGVFLLAPVLAARVLDAPHLAGALRLGSVMVFVNALGVAQAGALSGFEAFKAQASVSFVRSLLGLPAAVVGVWLYGIPGAIGASVLTAIAGSWLGHRALKEECGRIGTRVSFRTSRAELGAAWRFSVPVLLAGALPGPVAWGANVLLVHLPNGHAEMGLFSAADQWRLAVAAIPSVVGSVSLPLLSGTYESGDRPKFTRFLARTALLNAAIAGLVALPVLLLSRRILSFYGPGFAAARNTLLLMAVAAVLIGVNVVIGSAIIAVGSIWWGCLFNVLWAATLLSCWQMLLPLGAEGLALAYVLAYAAHTTWQLAYVVGLCKGLW
jgi:O-antigen/teichoic acid export membrane protein